MLQSCKACYHDNPMIARHRKTWWHTSLPLTALFLSGFTGLAYEIVWIRKAALAFGATSFALGTTLGLFFAGLALGSWFFGRIAPRTRTPLLLYGWLEVGVAILAALSPLLFRFADSIFHGIYPHFAGNPHLLTAWRFPLAGMIILPPTFLMGGSLPLFTRQFVDHQKSIATRVGGLYGLNTLGGFAGCATAGFLLVPAIGFNAVVFLCALINGVLGLSMIVLGRRIPSPPFAETDKTERKKPGATRPGTPSRISRVAVIFFLTGFAAMANEVIWTRYLAMLILNTVYTYTATLLVVLAGIGTGSVLAARLFDRSTNRSFYLGCTQGLTALLVPGILLGTPLLWGSHLHDTGQLSRIILFALIMFLPAALSGATFPLAVRMVTNEARLAGRFVGSMTAVNTAGGIAGVLLAGFLFLPSLGLQKSILLSSGISLANAFAAWLLLHGGYRKPLTIGAAIVSLVIWAAIPVLTGSRVPHDYLDRSGEIVDVMEGYESNLAAIRTERGLMLAMDRLWQGSDTKTAQIVAAHLPMHLHSAPIAVAGIGIGTGQTFSRFLLYPGIQSLVCVDIEKRLPAFLRKHFNSEWMDDPRTRIVAEDGRNYLTHTDNSFDIISLEPGQTYRPTVATFYTRDFYEIVRERLEPGGLVSQFIPIGIVGMLEFRGMLRTFLEVFPASSLWYNRDELLLIGSRSATCSIDWSIFAGAHRTSAAERDMEFAYWGGAAHFVNRPEVFLGGFLMGPAGLAAMAEGGPVYRDDLPTLEYSTSRQKGFEEFDIVELIRTHVESPAAYLVGHPPTGTLDKAARIRERNLGDIEASSLLDRARDFYMASRPQEALRLLMEARKRNPENRDVLFRLGMFFYQSGRVEESIQYFGETVGTDPDHWEARAKLAKLLSDSGRLEQALEHYAAWARLQPEEPGPLLQQASILSILGRTGESVTLFEKLVGKHPGLPDGWFRLGKVLLDREEFARSVDALQKGVSLQSDFAPGYVMLGNALEQRGDRAGAAAAFRRALEIKPDFSEAAAGLRRITEGGD